MESQTAETSEAGFSAKAEVWSFFRF